MKTMYVITTWLLLLIVIGITNLGVNESMADADSGNVFTDEKRLDASEKATAGKILNSEPLELSLRDFVRLVREKNEQISYQDAEWAISRAAVKGAKAIFEPAFVGAYQYQEDNRRNTVQEQASQGLQGLISVNEFYERSKNYQAAVEGLVPTGGRLRLGYSLRDFSSSVQELYRGGQEESLTVFGASFTQPLLKGGGIKATTAGIYVAEADADIAFQTYRGQMMRVISDAIAAYWDLSLALGKYKVRKESERNAEEILRDNIIRVKTGKMAETEVLETKAGLAMRKSLVSEAKQAITSAMNSMRTFYSSTAAETGVEIKPSDPIYSEEIKPDFADSLARAFKFRAEYIASRKKMKREDIRLVFAENQVWPQLDLKGSYNLNGLAGNPQNSWDDALKQDFKTWTVGIELRIPLGGDKKSRSELEATRQRKRQALLELKAVEVSLANTVDTAIKSVRNAWEQVSHHTSVVDMNKQLLEVEIARFESGKSNSRILLEREENLNKAKEVEIESFVRYKKALLQLYLAEGALLVNQGIEVMEASL